LITTGGHGPLRAASGYFTQTPLTSSQVHGAGQSAGMVQCFEHSSRKHTWSLQSSGLWQGSPMSEPGAPPLLEPSTPPLLPASPAPDELPPSADVDAPASPARARVRTCEAK
jgi:hypothetical protein